MGNVDVNYRMIGLNVSTYRYRLNLTQQELAEKAGLSKQFVGNIECGRAIPSLQTVLSLCHALDVTPNDLLTYSWKYNSDAPSTLRDDHSVYAETITEKLFPGETLEICIDPQDLPDFDIVLSDLPDEE